MISHHRLGLSYYIYKYSYGKSKGLWYSIEEMLFEFVPNEEEQLGYEIHLESVLVGFWKFVVMIMKNIEFAVTFLMQKMKLMHLHKHFAGS